MKTLPDLLKEYADKYQADDTEFRRMRYDWQDSVRRLITRLEQWLKQADKEQVLEVQTKSHSVREEGIGHYDVPGLVIHLGGRRVEIVPRARRVGGAIAENGNPPVPIQGLIYLTDGERRYKLYRIDGAGEGGEKWLLSDEDRTRIQPLDQETFEAAMVSLLQ